MPIVQTNKPVRLKTFKIKKNLKIDFNQAIDRICIILVYIYGFKTINNLIL